MTAIYCQNDWMLLIYLKQSGVSPKPITKITLIAETEYSCTIILLPRMATVRGKNYWYSRAKSAKRESLSISLPRFFKYSFTHLVVISLAISHDLLRNIVYCSC